MLALYKLDVFATVYRAGSFSAAAKMLSISQPAVSQHIQELETQLGTQLFQRAGARGVTPTAAGDLLYDYAERITALLHEAEYRLTVVENLKEGRIVVATTPGVSAYLFPDWAKTFNSRFPHLTMNLKTAVTPDAIACVLRADCCCGVIEGELDDLDLGALQVHALGDIPMHVVVTPNHKWAGASPLPVATLDGAPLIVRQRNSRTRRWFDGVCSDHGVKPHIVAAYDNQEAIKHAVLNGMGAAVLPHFSISREVADGTMVTVPLSDVSLVRQLKLVYSGERTPGPLARAFWSVIADDFPAINTALAAVA